MLLERGAGNEQVEKENEKWELTKQRILDEVPNRARVHGNGFCSYYHFLVDLAFSLLLVPRYSSILPKLIDLRLKTF